MKNRSDTQILPLAPNNNLNKSHFQFRVYMNHLDSVFKNNRIRNIALAGSLGSGKTSIIKSYDRQKNHGKEKFLYVSLIDFTPVDGGSKSSKMRLEYSLLCQVLSRCKKSDIAQSSLATIPTKSRFLRIASLALSMVCLTIYVLVFHEYFGKLAKLVGIPGNLCTAIHLSLYACMGGVMSLFLYNLLKKILPSSRFQKLTLKSTLAEAEFVLGEEPTSLDAYKLELIYALSQIVKRIDYTVVLEDLDRVEGETAVDIMEKLREINLLTNNYIDTHTPIFKKLGCCLLKKPSHIRFIYTIGEDILSHEQRTKFYDCIIPVVPALNHCNASQTIIKLLSKCGIDVYRESVYYVIRNIAPLVTNYRTLITIRNEYLVFADLYLANHKNRIDKLSYKEQATLLSIVIYKTFFPRKYVAAFSEFGQAKLERISDEDLKDFSNHQDYRKQIINVFDKLFEYGTLSPASLRMVGLTDALITERWLRILSNGSDSEKINLLSSLIKSDYTNNCEDQIEAKSFTKDIIKHNLLGKTTNITVSKWIASFLSSSKWNDYRWFFNGFRWGNPAYPSQLQKRHFTNCFFYVATENILALDTLCKKHGKKYIWCWCVWNLRGFDNHELIDYGWTPEMANTLVAYLKYDPDAIPTSVRSKYITNHHTIEQLLQAQLSAPV